MELRHLDHNPVEAIEWKAPKTTSEVDRRCVESRPGPATARRGARRLSERPASGRVHAVRYDAGLRPEEAVDLKRDNITLPPLVLNEETGQFEEPDGEWGELLFSTAAPEVGADWTDDGQRHDHRQLKARAAGEWRHVPLAPPLVRGGLVFTGVHGGDLSSATYRRVWNRARGQALTPAEYASPLARRVYDLRHACVSTWLSAGVPPVQVAEWAGIVWPSCSGSMPSASTARTSSTSAVSMTCSTVTPGSEPKAPLPEDGEDAEDQWEQPDGGD